MNLSFPEKPEAWNKKSLRGSSKSFSQAGTFLSYPLNFRATLSFAEWVELHMATVSGSGARPKDDVSFLLPYFFTIWLLISENLIPCTPPSEERM